MFEWEFIFTVLAVFGFGPKLISWDCFAYSSPEATIFSSSFQGLQDKA